MFARLGVASGLYSTSTLEIAEVPVARLCVQRDHRRGARCEHRCEQFVRGRSLVGPAEPLGFVGDDDVPAVDVDLVSKRSIDGVGGRWSTMLR